MFEDYQSIIDNSEDLYDDNEDYRDDEYDYDYENEKEFDCYYHTLADEIID